MDEFQSPPSKSHSEDASTSPTPKKTIVVWDVPANINKRKTLLDHFTQFGDVERLTCSLKSKYAIIMFNKAEEAELAKQTGTTIEGQKVQIFFTQKTPMGSGAKRRTPSTPVARPQIDRSAFGPYQSKYALRKGPEPKALMGPSFTKMRSSEDKESPVPGPSTRSTSRKFQDSKPLSISVNPSSEGSSPGRTISLAYKDDVFASSSKSKTDGIPSLPLFQASKSTKSDVIALPPPYRAKTELSIFGSTSKMKSDAIALPSSSTSARPKSDSTLALPSVSSSTSRPKSPAKLPESNFDILSLYPDSADAVELFGKKAVTAEDRYKVLEGRDKILRARIPKVKMRVELAAKLFGTCPDMCPEKERYMREYQRQLTPYEINQDQEVDHQKAIKAYSRSSADQEEPLPHELRPGTTLEMTMNYILHNIISRGESDEEILADWYNFVWDRTRSIRKDITQQQLCNSQAVSLMEKCTRFHIHCSSRLCELDRYSFDTKLNDENLMKCLQSLEHLYSDLRLKNIDCPNEPEFRSYQILMNLNEGDILWEIQQKPESILKAGPVQQALKIHHAVSSNNFVAFFRVVRQLPYLTSCIVHRYFFQVRSAALRTLVRSHSANQKLESWVSASMIQRMLGYGDDEQSPFMSLCVAHGINADQESDRIIISRRAFYLPETPTIYREAHLIESKLIVPIAESINGGPLFPNPYPSHIPQCSFDDEGYLIPGAIISTSPRTPSAKTSPVMQIFPISTMKPSLGLQSSFSALAASSTAPVEKPFFSFTLPTPPPAIQPAPAEVSASATIVLPPPPPYVPDPRIVERQRQQKMQAFSSQMANILFNKYQEDVITSVLQEIYLKTYDENTRIKTVAKTFSQKVSTIYFENIRSDVIKSSLQEIIEQESRSIRAQSLLSQEFLNSVVSSTIAESVSQICKDELSKHINASRLVAKRASELYGRIKLRGWVRIWRQFTEKKRTERKLLEESRRKLIRDFPAGNQYGKTVGEVLASWCGGNSSTSDFLVANVASFINETLHESSSEDEESSSSDESVEEKNDDLKCDTVSCSYEEFLQCYPGIEKSMTEHKDDVEREKESVQNTFTQNVVTNTSFFTRKRTLSPIHKMDVSSPPVKFACQGSRRVKSSTPENLKPTTKEDVVADVDVLCEDIKVLVSKSKIERYLWDTDMSVLDTSIEILEDELKSFHEEFEKSYSELSKTV